jgi:hypothetical protein
MARLNSLLAAVGNLQPDRIHSRGDYELALGCVWNWFVGDCNFRGCDDDRAKLYVLGPTVVFRTSRFVRLPIFEPPTAERNR